jgi:GTP-binding protein SAR1
VTIGNIRFNSYDLGGHQQARKTWKEYCGQLDGVIFLVDAADRDRLVEAKKELDMLMDMTELSGTPFVILGNKVDKKGSLGEEEFREALGMHYH